MGTRQDYEAEIGPKAAGRVRPGDRGHGHERRQGGLFRSISSDTNLDSRQIYFVNQIVEYIVHNGMMKDFSVLQETPFTDRGNIVELFGSDTASWLGIRKVIEQINRNAEAV